MDTRNCKFCGVEFNKVRFDEGTFDEGYCCKFHRKDHEKQLIREGRIKIDDDGIGFSVLVDSKQRDLSGEKIWFPKDGKPYFDKSLRKEFKSIQEKKAWMKEQKIVMHGSSSPKKWPIESGDMRSKEYRKRIKTED